MVSNVSGNEVAGIAVTEPGNFIQTRLQGQHKPNQRAEFQTPHIPRHLISAMNQCHLDTGGINLPSFGDKWCQDYYPLRLIISLTLYGINKAHIIFMTLSGCKYCLF